MGREQLGQFIPLEASENFETESQELKQTEVKTGLDFSQLAAAEDEVLEQELPDTSDSDKDKKIGRPSGLKKALRTVTTGLMILAASFSAEKGAGAAEGGDGSGKGDRQELLMRPDLSAAIAGEFSAQIDEAKALESLSTEEQKLNAAMAELQNKKNELNKQKSEKEGEKRFKELQSWLNDFKIKNLTIGKPKNLMRMPGEQLGIYLLDKHLGDIACPGAQFDQDLFKEQVAKVLREKKVKFNEAMFIIPAIEVKGDGYVCEVSPEAQKLMKKWGGGIEGKTINLSSKDNLSIESDSKRITISAGGKNLIVVCDNKDGSRDLLVYDGEKVISQDTTAPAK